MYTCVVCAEQREGPRPPPGYTYSVHLKGYVCVFCQHEQEPEKEPKEEEGEPSAWDDITEDNVDPNWPPPPPPEKD